MFLTAQEKRRIALSFLAVAAVLAVGLLWTRADGRRPDPRDPAPAGHLESELPAVTRPPDPGTGPADRATAASHGGDLELPVTARGRVLLEGPGWPSSPRDLELVLRSTRGKSIQRVDLGEDGSWVATLALGEWRLELRGRAGLAALATRPPAIALTPDGADTTVRATRLPAVEGEVLDCRGTPVAGVVVHPADRPTHRVRTGALGRFLLPFVSGEPSAILVDEATIPAWETPPWWQVLEHHEVRGREHLAAPSEPFTIRLGGMTPLRGVVTRGDRLVAGATVALTARFGLGGSVSGPNYVFETDDHGRFELAPVAPGPYEARLYRHDSGAAVRPRPVRLEIGCQEPGPISVGFDPPGTACVFGMATDHSGNAVPGLGFGIWPAGDVPHTARLNTLALASAMTDAEGWFHVCGFEPGSYVLVRTQSTKPDPAKVYVDDVPERTFTIAEDGEEVFVEWSVEVAPPVHVVARISDELLHRPENAGVGWVAAIRMTCDHGARVYVELLPDERGSFEGDLPPGVGQLELFPANGSLDSRAGGTEAPVASLPVALVPGETVQVVVGR